MKCELRKKQRNAKKIQRKFKKKAENENKIWNIILSWNDTFSYIAQKVLLHAINLLYFYKIVNIGHTGLGTC